MAELKPCPFCGGKAKVVSLVSFREQWCVGCTNCGGAVIAYYEIKKDAITAWNRRAGEQDG